MRFSLPTIKCSGGGSASQLLTTAEHYSFVWIVLNVLITTRSTVVGSWEQPPNMISLTVEKNAFVGWPLNFRVRMFLKGAISSVLSDDNMFVMITLHTSCCVLSMPATNSNSAKIRDNTRLVWAKLRFDLKNLQEKKR